MGILIFTYENGLCSNIFYGGIFDEFFGGIASRYIKIIAEKRAERSRFLFYLSQFFIQNV